MTPGGFLPKSKNFELQELTDGVYAAIATDGGTAICNAGIIDLGGTVLVFDAFMSPVPALELRRIAVHLTEKEPDYLVYSHYHHDHIRGAQAFKDSVVVGTEKTKNLVSTKGKEWADYDRETAASRLAEVQKASEDDIDRSLDIGYFSGRIESLKDLHLVLPSITFESGIRFHGTKRVAEVVGLSGHSESDAVLVLPDDGVGFLGDLLFVRTHPFLPDGDPDLFVRSLDQIEAMGLKTCIPGHGARGRPEDVQKMREYIRRVQDIAAEVIASGGGPAEARSRRVPDSYEDWKWRRFFPDNVEFCVEQRLAHKAPNS